MILKMIDLKVFLYFILFLVQVLTFAQSDEQSISSIRSEFKRINAHKTLDIIELENEEFLEHMTDGGGSLVGYFESEKLVKLTLWVGLSYGSIETEYYFKKGSLFFAYFRENRFADKYDESGELVGLDYYKINNVFEGRYYFNSNILLKKIEDGSRVFGDPFDKVQFFELANAMANKIKVAKK